MNTKQFEDLGICPPILKALDEMGFEAPTNIQAAAISKIIEGKDVAGQAQTGTGKTAAFAIPILQNIDSKLKRVQAVVMCPTRELAVQVTGEFIKLSKYLDQINITPVYGGQPIHRQIKQLKMGTHVVVGTPGRVIDHLKRGTLQLGDLKIIVLDEADEMLNMGFREDIETILGYGEAGKKLQTVMFSATMSPGIKKIMSRFFHDPEMIKVEGKTLSADGITQYMVEARDSMRTEGICRLLDVHNYGKALIFCNTKRACDELINEIQSRGYVSDVLHGDMSQAVRDKVMNKFRESRIDVLIATDVAARGLDIQDVDVVFNYDIPQDPEYYVHRIGRTGRAGKQGVAYTFASGRKTGIIRFLEKKVKSKIETIPLPSIKEVRASMMEALLVDVEKTMESGGLRPYIEQIESIIKDKFTPIEVAAALLKMQGGHVSKFIEKKPVEKETQKEWDEPKPARGKKRKEKKWDDASGKPFNKKKKVKAKAKKKEPFYAPFVKKKSPAKSKKGGKNSRA